MAPELGLAEDDAAAVVTQAVLDAAAVAGNEALDAVRDALPDEIRNLESGQPPSDRG